METVGSPMEASRLRLETAGVLRVMRLEGFMSSRYIEDEERHRRATGCKG